MTLIRYSLRRMTKRRKSLRREVRELSKDRNPS
jgi:hypothetical protein